MKKYKPSLIYDNHVIYCDICGRPFDSINATELEDDTGKGGLVVCNYGPCLLQIDYGLVPFELEPEASPEIVRIDPNQTSPYTGPSGYILTGNFDPMSGSPNWSLVPWEQILGVTWENWLNSTWEGDLL